ncbi:DUF523 and DUF1722 domain-containing protein [Terasakiella sp. A23]|uniref:YbgA family protein n=1 Tax=Terasakiella sp. FCG-A23 TaxID=3080561 RepID=UPI002952F354|nr:DUF523 and DUF1722 domain-containing protein [Terasakiella sp. A23]MDV7340263.1 DUF523 and DUF1722 domain-containing protein [Terasakiella sp. A23]
MDQKLNIGVSSCLLGEEVRFNGGHCRDRFLTDKMNTFASFTPTCPEMAINMGVPRESVRLERDETGRITMRAPKSRADYTNDMEAFSKDWIEKVDMLDLDGYVFKKNSPSCGVFRVKIYENNQPAERRGTGMFAKAVMDRLPELPVEEDGRLNDPLLRENFVERCFAFRRVKDLFQQGWTRKDVVAFHSREKLLLMAHSPKLYKELGRLVATIKTYDRDEFKIIYIKSFMECMNHKSSKGKHANALFHMAGYLKSKLTSVGRLELNKTIEDYRNGLVPLVVPMTLISHMIRRFDELYLAQQSYLTPHPDSLALRNHT